jgi:ribosomal-protein-alanine N-acetyltransferase
LHFYCSIFFILSLIRLCYCGGTTNNDGKQYLQENIVEKMNIRLYQAEDKKTCIELFKGNMPKYFAISELPEFELWLDAWERKKMQHRDPAVEQYFVIEVMNEVVGCGGYTKVNNDEITLTWGMISQSMHGKGIGKTLLQYRLGIVKSLFPNASVILDTTQLSYVFFERLGFKITGIIKDFYGQGLDRYDMKLTF